ncbi:Xaa-Pro dipeptidyl-peptidase [Burkholderia ubonensis]|uniref:Xaa-Pro dipeptidyl-peptidase n=1 Tax=Burkholderia ubonensis TaxID=101571 RepID=UPI000753A943|nr:Xaa-Pro dipeptidyl-peptidase [Burkholderia ubonensis]KVN79782.1 X-prolyl-dipeptidyl aminopeptidase [Burkholderia ubonensis]KVX07993.1 X-prolyl-dipeptidyl aminopeptidase [Burkholderia ubonensis]KVZ86421.1 X-prolyl-dipeptidyl aminopeptidase [Burkholderia ubonensis]KWD61463.1 X-prolyl-dipeptidyl aminopeptidase [Burkholderia ubonensis]KWD64184.1 X-prolyl-dipeptidyl aminopeptidase [Burkholderia ubonensis]
MRFQRTEPRRAWLAALVAAATLAACGGEDSAGVPGASALAQGRQEGAAAPAADAQPLAARFSPSGVPYAALSGGRYPPVIQNGQVQPSLSGATINEEAWVETPVDSDGDGARDRIHVRVVRPTETASGARTPVIVLASPYYNNLADSPNHNVDVELDGTPHPAASSAARIMAAAPQTRILQQVEAAAAGRSWIEGYFVQRGFTIVYADSLGTAGSDGCPTILTRDESVAMASVIRWLGRGASAKDASGKPVVASWSTGHVGMYGVSYDGTLPKMVASLRTRGLDAIVPVAGLSNMYGYYRSGGLVRAPDGYQGEDVDVYIKALLTNPHPERCTHLVDDALKKEDRTSGDYSAFWAARDIPTALAVAPALVAQGLTDDNVRVDQSTSWYLAMRRQGVPAQLWLHRLKHTDPTRVPAMAAAWTAQVNRWFTRYLLGFDNGVERDPGAVIEQADGTLLKEASWPARGAASVAYFAGGDGAGTGTLLSTPTGGPLVKFTDDARITALTLANATTGEHRSRFETAPLASATRISGTATARVRLTFSAVANVTALLVDRAPDGSATIVTRAWTDPRNRVSSWFSEPVLPGMPYDLRLTFMPRDYRLEAGHRLGLVVLSSDNEATLRPTPGTELSLDPAGTSVTVPQLPI